MTEDRDGRARERSGAEGSGARPQEPSDARLSPRTVERWAGRGLLGPADLNAPDPEGPNRPVPTSPLARALARWLDLRLDGVVVVIRGGAGGEPAGR